MVPAALRLQCVLLISMKALEFVYMIVRVLFCVPGWTALDPLLPLDSLLPIYARVCGADCSNFHCCPQEILLD